MNNIVFIITLLFVQVKLNYSQVLDTIITLYKFKTDSYTADVIKRELDILKFLNPTITAISINFDTEDCDDTLYRVTFPTKGEEVLGFLEYKGMKVYLEGKEKIYCKLESFSTKVKDTNIVFPDSRAYLQEIVGQPGKGIFWYNIFYKDTISFVTGYYDYIEYKIKPNLYSTNRVCKLDEVIIKLKNRVSIKRVYFSYFKLDNKIFKFEVFYPFNRSSELDYLMKKNN